MPARDDEIRFIIEVGPSKKRVAFYRRPSPQEMNLLFVLVEAAGVEVHPDQLCSRLMASLTCVRVNATGLRKKLAGEWIVDVVNNRGMRLLYAPYQTDEVDKIAPDVRVIRLCSRDDAFQKGLRQHTEHTKRMISRSMSHSVAV